LHRIRVKICGLTRVKDAEIAANLGADALGMVFYPPSPRHITVEKAAEIVGSLPAFVSTVGLFVNPTVQEVEAVLAEVPLDVLQFHGDEQPSFCSHFSRPYIKAIRVKPGVDLNLEARRFNSAQSLLLDAWHPKARGGTGQSFDWAYIPPNLPLPVILAGGLSPSNVRTAIERVRPFAVDVSSGVESRPGIKDSEKMAAFIQEVTYGDCTRAA